MKTLLTVFALFAALHLRAADTLRVLFIGNSYVQVNTLPALIANAASSQGKVLQYTDASVGGQTFQGHLGSTQTQSLLRQKGWDFIVLQEQSQRPAFPDAQVARDTYPYARRLDSIAHVYNPCAKTVFYMTWGRKNGDAMNCAGFPLLCTYEGMDSLLQSRYGIMAQQAKALLAPAAVVWRQLRLRHPGIELYQADESHPSLAGSYAAACTFYSILFRADPAALSYDAGLSGTDAAAIRKVVKEQVYDSLSKWYAYDPPTPLPAAAFSHSLSGRQATFSNTSLRARSYRWDFGDGKSDTAATPVHTYLANGSYTVRLIASNCGNSDTETKTLVIGPASVGGSARPLLHVYPNPARRNLNVTIPEAAEILTIISLQGQALVSQQLQGSGTADIDVSGLPGGMYILELGRKSAPPLRTRFQVAH